MTAVKTIASEQSHVTNNQFFAHRIGVIGSWFVIFVFVFTSLRGWAVLNLALSAELVYGFSGALIIFLASYGFSCRFRIRDRRLTSLRNLLLINGLMGFYHVAGTKLLGGALDVSAVYTFLLPYIVFLFFRISVDKIHLGLFLILFGISFSVISCFIISISGDGGIVYLEEYNEKLRPLILGGNMSHTGDYLRVGGYTASYHDSANILGMIGSYYYIKSIINKSILYIIIATVAFFAMMLTQSAANIILALITCIIFTIYIGIKKPTTGTWLIILIIAIVGTLIVSMFPEVLIFSKRVGEDGDWEGMAAKLGLDMLFNFSFWVGFGYSTGSEFVTTEVAFLKGILEHGIIPATLLYWILIYPVYVFIKSKSDSLELLPYLAAIVFGFISLSHYGSLMRVTNVAIFYAMYALFFIKLITDKNNILKEV